MFAAELGGLGRLGRLGRFGIPGMLGGLGRFGRTGGPPSPLIRHNWADPNCNGLGRLGELRLIAS